MQQLFTVSRIDGQHGTTIGDQVFSVPTTLQASVEAQLLAALKTTTRGRKAGHKRAREVNDASATRIPCHDLSHLKRIMAYGPHHSAASDAFRRRLAALRRLREPAPATSVATPGGDDEASETELCRFVVREGMSLVGRVVAADTTALLLRPVKSLTKDDKASSPPQGSQCAAHTTVELYCVLQSLEVELVDALTFPSEPTTAQATRMEAQSRILACVDALEETLLDMVLSRAEAISGAVAPASGSVDEKWAALRALLLALPGCFTQADWPSRLVVNTSAAPPPAHLNSDEVTAGGEAVASILLRALTAVKQSDACDLLKLGSAPPVAGLAVHASQVPSDLDPEHCSFPLLLGRTWNGTLPACGLRRAMLEARVFFAFQSRHCATKVSPKHVAKTKKESNTACRDRNELGAPHTTTRLQALQCFFAACVEQQYSYFLSHLDAHGSTTTTVSTSAVEASSLAPPPTVFDLFHSLLDDSDASLSEAQQRALRVLERVKAFDSNGWFAVPAFDLVNIDFSSLRFYVRSHTFARKSKRGAFDALRRLLEQMVDRCVAKYGPTHEFSDCISTLRHRLVDSARQEQLL